MAFLSRLSHSQSQEGGILSSDSWSVFRGFSFTVFLAILWGQNQGKAVKARPLISHSHLLSPWQRQRCDRLLHKQGNPFDKTACAVYPCAQLFVKVLLCSAATRMHKHIMELSLLHASWTQGDALSVSEALTDRKTELFARNFFFFFLVCGEKNSKMCQCWKDTRQRWGERHFLVYIVFWVFFSLYLEECLEAKWRKVRKVKEREGECDPDMIQAKFKPGSLWANTSYMLWASVLLCLKKKRKKKVGFFWIFTLAWLSNLFFF